MENGIGSALYPVLEQARRNERIPASGLPTLGAMIDAYVGLVLDATSYNIGRSAGILEISRSTLYRRMRKKASPA
jgi:transcriptional regulator of acetoin/glycerol metabolism